MMSIEKFNRMDLPRDSSNEGLETLSRQKLLPLFPIDLFELRDENQRDKGIDLIGEIKRNGSYTNFRFAVQLKATATSTNVDGSVSFPIDVSNINYLMNNGMPAYYILYQKDHDIFYYESANHVFEALSGKYPAGNYPQAYSVRFEKSLTTEVLKKLHEEIFQRGILLRQLNEMLQVDFQREKLNNRIVIDEKQQVYSKEEKIKFIEEHGFLLLNKREFKRIIEAEEQCYPLTGVSPSFYFVVGMAYYHRAQMYKALDHFKNAKRNQQHLNSDLQSMLDYYYEMAKYALGMTSEEAIGPVIEQMKQSDYLNLFLRIQTALDLYLNNTGDENAALKRFFDEMDSVKHNSASDDSMAMIANAHILLINGLDVNNRICELLFDEKSMGFTTKERQEAHRKLIDWFDERAQDLQNIAMQQGNMVTYFNVCMNTIRIKYRYIAQANYITQYDLKSGTVDFKLTDEEVSYIELLISILDDAIKFFDFESFIENLTLALSIKFELQSFISRQDEARSTADKLLRFVEANDLYALKAKYKALVEGHTTHEKLFAQTKSMFNAMGTLKEESRARHKKIQELNAADKALNHKPDPDDIQIQIIPIGFFSFPREKEIIVYDLINASSEARAQIQNVSKTGAIPIVNIFNTQVLEEGPGDGVMANNGTASDKNIYRIRVGLHDNQIFRLSN